MKQIPTVSKSYFENNISDYGRGKNKEEIWSFINVKGLTVIDFGVGEPTEKLRDLGALVIAVDKDGEKLKKNDDNLRIPLIKCDIANLPFHNRIADLAVFHFILHEVDPLIHKKAISDAYKISSRILVVEPSPKGCPAYQRYAELWRRAMHSINRFEDYQPASYWKKLIEDCGFKIIVFKKVKQSTNIPHNRLEEIVQSTIEEWRKLSVESRYVNEMKEFLEYAKKNGMKWSDLIVIVGENNKRS